jgi:hypothetical protein
MHDFKIGQYVYYVPRRAEGRYVVMRLLPQPKGKLRYIIRSQAEPEREYAAHASELRRVRWAIRLGPKRRLYIETRLIRSALLCHLSF